MKYCVEYKKQFRYTNDVDELTITFNRNDESLLDFLLAHKNQRIIIEIKNKQDEFIAYDCIKFFDAAMKKYPDLNFAFNLGNYSKTAPRFYALFTNYQFFFADIVTNWDKFNGLLELGVSDIYIAEDICFELDKVAEIAHSKNVQLRVFPNVAQSSWYRTPALKKFFIRPEDIPVYEQYIDVCEFYGRDNSIETMFRVYAIDKKWFGKLNELIISFDSEIDSRNILPNFAEKRVKCGKKCAKGRPCRICDAMENLSAVLEKNDLTLTQLKK
jgi:hypothetical protein